MRIVAEYITRLIEERTVAVEIKALKTLVWHLSREQTKEMSSFEKINNQ